MLPHSTRFVFLDPQGIFGIDIPHNVVAHGLPKVVPLWMDACKSNLDTSTWAMALALQRTPTGPSLCSMSGLMN